MDISTGETVVEAESAAVESEACRAAPLHRVLKLFCSLSAVLGREIGGFSFDLFRR